MESTKNKIIKMIIGQGIFAVLFVGLLLYVINDATQREEYMQATINQRLDDIDVMVEKLEQIQKDINIIKGGNK